MNTSHQTSALPAYGDTPMTTTDDAQRKAEQAARRQARRRQAAQRSREKRGASQPDAGRCS